MEYTHLGRSGLTVSRLCLGTMNFGPLTAPDEAQRIMDHAHELGINFFDTANRYGRADGPPGQAAKSTEGAHSGWTEEIIGDWFAGASSRREKTVLATKLYGDMDEWPNYGRLSALNIRRACEASLRRLRTDYIDLYQMHHVDRDTPWDEIWQAMEVLVAQGKVLYVGSSNFSAWEVVDADWVARRDHRSRFVSAQNHYSLLHRGAERDLLAACERAGVGLLPYFPLANGLLTGKYRKGAERPTGTRMEGRDIDGRTWDRIEALAAFADERGHTLLELAFAGLLASPVVSSVIAGATRPEQVKANAAAGEWELTAADRDALAAL